MDNEGLGVRNIPRDTIIPYFNRWKSRGAKKGALDKEEFLYHDTASKYIE